MANRPLTVRIWADTQEQLQNGLIEFAACMDDPDHIAAIRLGDCYAEMDLMFRPMDPKRLH